MCLALLSAPLWAAERITMDFQEADIRTVIQFMAELTGTNYLIDDKVQGKVTIITPKGITKEEAQRIFASILEVKGYALVPAGEVVKIVPASEAKHQGVRVRRKPPPPGDVLVSQLIPLKHADAEGLVPLLRPLVSPASYLAAYTPSNTLILTDYAGNVRRILDIIQSLDVPKGSQGVRRFKLRYASATQVGEMLKKFFEEKGKKVIRVLPDSRTNTLVVLAEERRFPRIASLIQSLDEPAEEARSMLHVLFLKNADAEEMAKVLERILKELGEKGGFVRPVKVIADKATNALLISADPKDYETLKEVIAKLDIRRLQVYVEGLILEVSADRSREFGIEWRATGDFTEEGKKPFGGTNFGTIGDVSQNPFALGQGLALGIVDGLIEFRGQSFANIGALVHALRQETEVNILSTPNLLTMDNAEAEIIVGQNVPFLTGTVPTTDGLSTPFQTIRREDIGLKLRIKPQISEGELIRLDIYQEISSVAENTLTQAKDIITNKRSIETSVLVREGQMIALGGLIRDDTTDGEKKVPVLGDVPLFGHLFKSKSHKRVKTNLMVFLRPYVIRRPEDLERLSQRKYQDLSGKVHPRQPPPPPRSQGSEDVAQSWLSHGETF